MRYHDGTGGFSISLWMNAGLMTGTEQILLAKTVGPNMDDYVWSLSQLNSTAVRFRLQTAGVVTELTTTGSSLFSGAWYHLAATYDGAMMRLYINGALITFTPKAGNMPWAPMSPASMGDRLDGFASFLGHLDDVRLYDHGLSEPEIFDILLGDVTTQIAEQPAIGSTPEGDIVLPTDLHGNVQVFDLHGQLVLERNGVMGGTLSLRDGAPGLYLVCLQGPRGVVPFRFMRP